MSLASEALLDLYDPVQVVNEGQDIDAVYRVTSIDHEITPGKWLVTFTFEAEGLAAPPQVIPRP